MNFEKGKSGNPGGRPKGSRNKATVALKEAILKAAELAGGEDGLVGYLKSQASENPGPFMALLGKVLPMLVAGDVDHPVIHEVRQVIVYPDAYESKDHRASLN